MSSVIWPAFSPYLIGCARENDRRASLPALLRAEKHFSYTLIGLYSALWAFGTVLVGVSFAAMAPRLPRAVLLWGTAGAGLFAATHAIALTLLGTAVLGFAGTILRTCTQVILSDRHAEHRDRALTEANIGAFDPCVVTLTPGARTEADFQRNPAHRESVDQVRWLFPPTA
jgi:hypothetical protein